MRVRMDGMTVVSCHERRRRAARAVLLLHEGGRGVAAIMLPSHEESQNDREVVRLSDGEAMTADAGVAPPAVDVMVGVGAVGRSGGAVPVDTPVAAGGDPLVRGRADTGRVGEAASSRRAERVWMMNVCAGSFAVMVSRYSLDVSVTGGSAARDAAEVRCFGGLPTLHAERLANDDGAVPDDDGRAVQNGQHGASNIEEVTSFGDHASGNGG